VTLAGRLETLDIPAILQTLAVGGASGRLTLTRLDRHAVVVLRHGRVVYAAGGSTPQTLAAVLLRHGLVGERELIAALERQHDGQSARRLGDVLVEMGLLAPGTLQDVVRKHIQDLLGELLAWKSGFFRFEPAQAGAAGSVEVDVGDFVLAGGIAPQELLMRAVAALDRGDATIPPTRRELLLLAEPAPEPAPAQPATSPTGSYAADYTGEAVLSLLRFASQILARAVVFAVHGDHVAGVGEFGVEIQGRPATQAVRDTVLPLRDPSVLRLAVERRRSYAGPVEPTRTNLQLLERLGGLSVNEAVVVPLLVRGEPAFLLYGDQGQTGRPLEALDALESAAARAARIIEKTLAARDRERQGGE
jgi:hypothetical protein